MGVNHLFYLFIQEMWKSSYKFGTKKDFAFIFSLVTPIITLGKITNPAKSFAIIDFWSKLSPKCTNERLGVLASHELKQKTLLFISYQ